MHRIGGAPAQMPLGPGFARCLWGYPACVPSAQLCQEQPTSRLCRRPRCSLGLGLGSWQGRLQREIPHSRTEVSVDVVI